MKRHMLAASVGLAILPLAACGGGNNKADSASTAAASPTSTSSSSTTTTPTTTASSSSSTSNTSAASISVSSPSTTVAATQQRTSTRPPSPTRTSKPVAHKTFPPPSPAQEAAADTGSTRDCSVTPTSTQIEANAAVTCPFAQAVEAAWDPRLNDAVIYVKSPKTGDTFGLHCGAGAHGSSCATSAGGYIWMRKN